MCPLHIYLIAEDSQPGSLYKSRTVKSRSGVTQEWEPVDKDYERWTEGKRKEVAERICRLVWDYAGRNGKNPSTKHLPGDLPVVFTTHTARQQDEG
jgi:hypothetical protein